MKKHVTNAGNTVVPAVLAIQEKGFAVRCERSDLQTDETWYAETEDLRFSASDPLSLLGLITMVEARGENWEAQDSEIERFLNEFGYE
jgi:hypothetical protein